MSQIKRSGTREIEQKRNEFVDSGGMGELGNLLKKIQKE